MNFYVNYNASMGGKKPNTIMNKNETCLFCQRELFKEINEVVEENGAFLLVKNKYPVIEKTNPLVLIEDYACGRDISNYEKKHLDKLFEFTIKKWIELEQSRKFKSVVLFKNHGTYSGGSIHHPHMQIIGFEEIDYREKVSGEHFKGHVIYETSKVESNLSTKPENESYEFNVIITNQDAISEMADCIQIATHYILNHLNTKYRSFNLMFYQFEGKIICKIVSRTPVNPLLLGYGIIQVPNNLKEHVRKIQELYYGN